MSLYTHVIYSEEEPLWLFDYSPCFEIKNHEGVALAKDMNNKLRAFIDKGTIDAMSIEYYANVYVDEDLFEAFEFTCLMHDCRFKRLHKNKFIGVLDEPDPYQDS